MPKALLGDSYGNVMVSIIGYPFGYGNVASCNRPLYDAIITKLSADGEIIWSRCYGGDEEDVIMCITELPDGYIFAGETESEDGNLEGAGYHIGYPHNNPSYGRTRDIWLMKTDFDGNVLWSRCYGGSGKECPNKIFQNEDGGFTVFGTSNSIDGDVESTHNLQYNNEQMQSKIWVFRTDDQGNLIWERAIGTQKRAPETVADVIKHNDKEYTIAATAYPNHFEMTGDYYCSNDTIIPYSNENFWVLHITDIFNYDDPTGIEEQPKVDPFMVKVYPNPTQGLLTVSGKGIRQVRLYDLLGQQVAAAPSYNGNNVMLNTSSLAAGIYMVQVFAENGMYVKHVVVGGAY